ncbi:hypothetical protein YSA_10628 [Pseudomonas putida ND6]|uniref:Uncharacterized protein n=1 Tax=Pseudomonas putida ND6 TaxID=231023 RepID=I3V456_PSEPU|nr:hypothetical protein YSA_10628 [Pseudomonas putida ND6]
MVTHGTTLLSRMAYLAFDPPSEGVFVLMPAHGDEIHFR